MNDSKKESLLAIRSYNFIHEALVDKAKLESAGINCFLKNENMQIIQPFFSQSAGGIKLMVLYADSESAIEILNDIPESND